MRGEDRQRHRVRPRRSGEGTFQALLDADLYLPKSWDEDRDRCRDAGIPDGVRYRAKWRIAFDQLMRIPYFEEGLRNSLLVSTTAAIVTTLLGTLGAYAIARLRFPARSATYTAVMIAYMLPGVAILVPLVAIFKGLHLIDTLPGMAIGHIALTVPLVTWILIGTFEGVEPELEHAARIDGASRLQALRRVVLPLTVPSVVTAAVFGFVLSWNDLLVSKVLYVGSTPMLAPAIVNLMDPINRIEPQLSMAGLMPPNGKLTSISSRKSKTSNPATPIELQHNHFSIDSPFTATIRPVSGHKGPVWAL